MACDLWTSALLDERILTDAPRQLSTDKEPAYLQNQHRGRFLIARVNKMEMVCMGSMLGVELTTAWPSGLAD
jgi:hypothetical protein